MNTVDAECGSKTTPTSPTPKTTAVDLGESDLGKQGVFEEIGEYCLGKFLFPLYRLIDDKTYIFKVSYKIELYATAAP